MIEENKESSADFFQNTWQTYQAVVDNNYMFHRELSADVNGEIASRFGKEPISMMDLGCGDSSQIKNFLNGINLDYYHGCDLADAPLNIARNEIKGIAKRSKFECTDMLKCLIKNEDKYNLIFSCFALHHLSTENKTLLFQKVRNSLKPGGIFILVDIASEANEDLDSYHNAYISFAKENWTKLRDCDLNLIEEHVMTFDFPETIEDYEDMASHAGFLRKKVLGRYTWHTAICFET